LRLSEAIREGSEQSAPLVGGGLTDDALGACAMGAAVIGAVGRVGAIEWKNSMNPKFTRFAEERFGFNPANAPCPSCENWSGLDSLVYVVFHLNDYHRWTREAIADWVQAQEAIHGIGQDTEETGGPAVEARELVTA